MIKPQVPLDLWCTRHGLTVKSVLCRECGSEYLLNVPVAISGYRGLTGNDCEKCGAASTRGVFRPVDPEEKSFWYSMDLEVNSPS